MQVDLITKRVTISQNQKVFTKTSSFELTSGVPTLCFIDKCNPYVLIKLNELLNANMQVVVITLENRLFLSHKNLVIIHVDRAWYIHTLFLNPFLFRFVMGIGSKANTLAKAFSVHTGFALLQTDKTQDIIDITQELSKAILIKPCDGIGDILMTLPSAKVYYDRGYRISYLVWHGGYTILNNIDWIDNIFIDKVNIPMWKFSHYFDLCPLLNNYNEVVNQKHRTLSTAILMGLKESDIVDMHPVVNLTEEEEEYGRAIVKDLKHPTVLVSLDSWHEIRRTYPIHLRQLLIDKLFENGYSVIFTNYTTIKKLNNCLYLSGETSLRQFFSLIKNVDAIITTDTSALHIAYAFDKPTILLPSNIDADWRMYSNTYVVKPKVSCYPCNEKYIKGTKCRESKSGFVQCTGTIDVGDIVQGLNRFSI